MADQHNSQDGGSVSTTPLSLESLQAFAQAHNEFAVALYRQLPLPPGNLFFSPFSIWTALGMVFAGARGETASEMKQVLRFPFSDETLHGTFAKLLQDLVPGSESQCEMAVANSLWSQKGMPLVVKFEEVMARYYDRGLHLVDFQQQAEKARGEINRWVEDKTRRKIKELIPQGEVNTDTRLVLVNAVFFKGQWELPFPEHRTWDQPFYLDGQHEIEVPLMFQQEEIRYLHADGFQAVDLAYKESDLSMLILLPKEKSGLRDLEAQLSANWLRDCVEKLQVCEVKLHLPRFKFTWGTVNLQDPLTNLDMRLAFTRFKADFSGINGYDPPDENSLFIAGAFHQACVEVKEEGTEAGAATAVSTMLVGGIDFEEELRIPVFRADHPFVFAIRDRKLGVILFLGRVTDPTKAN